MTPATTFAGESVAVFGLGRSGMAAAQALLAGGARVAAWDDEPASRQAAAAAAIPTADLARSDWSQFRALILAPGIPLTHPEPHWSVLKARAAGVAIIGDIELFCRERALACAGGAVHRHHGNERQIDDHRADRPPAAGGGPRRCDGRQYRDRHLGAGAPGAEPGSTSSRCPPFRSSSLLRWRRPSASSSIFRPITSTATAALSATLNSRRAWSKAPSIRIVGDDDDWCQDISERLRLANRTWVDLVSAQSRVGTRLVCRRQRADRARALDRSARCLCRPRRCRRLARSPHNIQNALAASAAAMHLGVAPEQIAGALSTFPGLPHRLQEVGRLGATLFINDSKATNANSAATALAAFPGDIFWILGGKPKAGGITSLEPYFTRIKKAFLIGEATEEFAATLSKQGGFRAL